MPTADPDGSAAEPAMRSLCTATRTSTPDGLPLTADHSIGRSRGGMKADRLVLAAYNRSRGARDQGDRYAASWWAREWTGGEQLAC
jgi:hypothetical protein